MDFFLSNAHIFIMLGYVLLLFNKESKEGAEIMLSAFLIYCAFIFWLPGGFYYGFSGTLNLLLGCGLLVKYPIPALLSFSLIFVNFFGYSLYYDFQEPDKYDNLFILILFLQFLFMLPKGLINGITFRVDNKHSMVRPAHFDSCNTRDKIHKNPITQTKAK